MTSTRLRTHQVPDWRAMPLAVVFLYGASGGREPWRHRLRNRVTGLPWHCLLYLGEDDITFDATPEHGVRMHPIGRATLTRVLGGTVFTVLEPPVVSLMPCDVQTVFTRAMAQRGRRYDWLGALLPWLPFRPRTRWTAADFVADSLGGIVAHILEESATPRQLETRLARAGWTRTIF